MQRTCGGVSDGNEFQHPIGVIWIVAEEEERLCRVK
jgi:hypothetical protein